MQDEDWASEIDNYRAISIDELDARNKTEAITCAIKRGLIRASSDDPRGIIMFALVSRPKGGDLITANSWYPKTMNTLTDQWWR